MSLRTQLIRDNQQLLEQGAALLVGLTEDAYARKEDVALASSIGGHVRHVIDYYDRFHVGLGQGRVDYDARAREERLERDVDQARQKLHALRAELSSVDALAMASGSELAVQLETTADTKAAWSQSSIERELQFLLSHTVHHFALIAIILRVRGIETPEGFGVARSTLAHREEARPCAH